MTLSSSSYLPFAGRLAEEVALRVDQDERRPGRALVGVPDLLVGVVDDRVLDLVAQDRLADRLRVLLVLELGRVDADDDELVGILLLELGQVGQDVDAVDAAERPEVEQDDLALEVLERDGLPVLSQAMPPSGPGPLSRPEAVRPIDPFAWPCCPSHRPGDVLERACCDPASATPMPIARPARWQPAIGRTGAG